jgi:hypothetical protein
MKAKHLAITMGLFALGGLNLAHGADKTLVPGDPPLTQGSVDKYRDFFTCMLAVKLDADENKKFQALTVADWKDWNKAARNAFVKQMVEWDNAVKKLGQSSYCAKILPGYLDRQGDAKKTSASERWMLEKYQSTYKKLADDRPIALMDKQPASAGAEPGKYGFPADPKHANVFPKAIVFTKAPLYVRQLFVDNFYVDRVTGETHISYQYWWFYPTGRFYTRIIRCEGTERVKDKDTFNYTIGWWYLQRKEVTYDWGRYTIDDKDRIQIESDNGDKTTAHLTHGRQYLNWAGSVFDGSPSKEKK